MVEQAPGQEERYMTRLIQQVENRAGLEIAEMKSALTEALDSMSMTHGGRYLAAVRLIEQIGQQLERSREEGAVKGSLQEEPLRQVVSQIEDPVLCGAVEATGNFILKAERETEMPISLSSAYYVNVINDDLIAFQRQ